MRRLVLSGLLLVLLFVPSVSRAQLTNSDCLDCHNDKTATKDVGGKQVSIYVNKDAFEASVHSVVNCTDCHADVTAYPHDPAPALDRIACETCHPDEQQAYANSIHAKAHAKGNAKAAVCVTCHGSPHEIVPRDDPRSRVSRHNIPTMCGSCHGVKFVAGKTGGAPQTFEAYSQSVHGKAAIVKGFEGAAVCSDCHGAHAILPPTDPKSAISHQNVPTTCKKCHELIFDQFKLSTHGQVWEKGETRGPVCSTCHGAHSIKNPRSASFREGLVNQCSNCHTKEAPTYRDTFHGQATALGFESAAKCADCHTAHLNLPKSDPRSSVNPKNLRDTCGQCHEDVNANFITYAPHADPHNRASSPQLYYVYNYLMKWLLLITFGFFGIHTLLWLQRSLVAWKRGEIHQHLSGPGKWVQRFKRKDRVTHVFIVLSFLVLAGTGIPLMYSYTGWGKVLNHFLGGVGGTTVLHRIFAVVTFGYAIVHLGHIIGGALKKDRAMFAGPESMLPQVRDLMDMKNMFRWFFYRGPQPKLDRWAYWEKFDYFAVFWGVPVIGLSGLMLWIPEYVTRVLPGWALNVAMLVHGDEALLAVGFIFTFHFFHNHLRPENFPLDPVMFTGKLPLERFKEERTDEYERLSREGRLDEIVVAPPTHGEMLFARWFGFSSLLIGVIIAIGIYYTFISRFLIR